MKKATITIHVQALGLPNVVQRVQAKVFGLWAVHREVNREGWMVTHVPCGLRVASPFETEEIALTVAHALHRKFPRLGARGKLGVPPESVRAQVYEIRKIIDTASRRARRRQASSQTATYPKSATPTRRASQTKRPAKPRPSAPVGA